MLRRLRPRRRPPSVGRTGGASIGSCTEAVSGSCGGSCSIGHRVSSTISPGAAPVARSVSSACCRISTAAAWSTTARRLPALAAPVAQHSLRRHGGQRSSTSRTGTRRHPPGQRGRRTRAPWPPPVPRRPDRDRGSPTTTSTAPSSSAMRRDPGQVALAAPHRLDRGRQEARTGRCGRRRSGRPRGRCRAGRRTRISRQPTAADLGADQRHGLVDPGGVGATALGDVVLAAALAADQRTDRADQLVGAERRAPGPRR